MNDPDRPTQLLCHAIDTAFALDLAHVSAPRAYALGYVEGAAALAGIIGMFTAMRETYPRLGKYGRRYSASNDGPRFDLAHSGRTSSKAPNDADNDLENAKEAHAHSHALSRYER